jgi:hypothetical protein
MPNLSSSSRKDYNRIIGSTLQETLPASMDSFVDLQILSHLLQELRADGDLHDDEIIESQQQRCHCSKQEFILPSMMNKQENN